LPNKRSVVQDHVATEERRKKGCILLSQRGGELKAHPRSVVGPKDPHLFQEEKKGSRPAFLAEFEKKEKRGRSNLTMNRREIRLFPREDKGENSRLWGKGRLLYKRKRRESLGGESERMDME